jgi:membrane fusion protein (multidrug efflux system)
MSRLRPIGGRPARTARALVRLLPIAGLLAAAVACKKEAPPAPPPPEVLVTTVSQSDVPIYSEWVGTTDGFVNAEIRPKVDGYVLERVYREGSVVRKGQPLFKIDPRQFQAALDRSVGDLGRAKASLSKAQLDVTRYTPLAAQKAISQQELDDAVIAERAAKATVEAAQAGVEQAQLNLAWTKVDSPIDGVAGIALSQVGNLVGPQTVMTTVSTVDPIKIVFSISEQEYMRYAAAINAAGAPEQDEVLQLVLSDGTTFAHKGKLLIAGRQIDVKTGTITIEGSFPNPGNLLRPGQFATVRAVTQTQKGAILVPQRAVSDTQGAFSVVVVGPDNKAELRPVKTGPRLGSQWVINEGLKAGDRVIVEGLQRVRSGMAVVPKQAPPSGEAAPAPAPTAAG